MLRAAFTLAFLVMLVQSADPLSKVDAEKARLRLKKVKAFAEGHITHTYAQWLTNGKANQKTFVDTCTTNVTCKQKNEGGKDGICCKDGEKKCEADKDGEEYKNAGMFKCIDAKKFGTVKDMMKQGVVVCGTSKGQCNKCMAGNMINPSGSRDKGMCENSGACTRGGATTIESMESDLVYCQAECYIGQMMIRGPGIYNHTCKSGCSDPRHTNESACGKGQSLWFNRSWEEATFVAGKYTEDKAATDKTTCGKADKCYRCEGCAGTCPGDRISCTSGSQGHGMCNITITQKPWQSKESACDAAKGIWTQAKWVEVAGGATEDTCQAAAKRTKGNNMGNGEWIMQAKWEKGKALAVKSYNECSTGPTHSEPSHLLKVCAPQSLFLQDAAADKTVTASIDGNKTYYNMIGGSIIQGAKVVNHANATSRAAFTLTKATCFVIVSEAENHGKFVLDGSNKTLALILSPNNAADADDLEVKGGSAMVLGGSNAGNIKSSTSKALEVYDLTNTGNLTVTKSQGIVIANVKNNGGMITVTDVVVTLIDVVSSGKITAMGSKGKYNAYNIVNTGTISIAAGMIDLHFKCNTGGTVTIGSAVTGKISYANGCKGTITAPSAVVVTELAATGATAPVALKKVSGNLKLKVPAAKAATFKTDAKVKMALQAAIASQITGVDKEMVAILGVTSARRLATAANQTTINVKYEITLPKGSSVTPANIVTTMTGATTKTSLATFINTELTKQGLTSLTVTVEETTATEKVTPTTTLKKSSANDVKLSQILDIFVLMGMIGAQFLL